MVLLMGMATLGFLYLALSSLDQAVQGCNQLDRSALQSFHHHISAAPSLNWSQSTDCCKWEGVACTSYNGIDRVTQLWLPEKHLSGTITPLLANLSFLSHLNLSHNHLSGPLPLPLLSHSLQTLDLSFNHLSGPLPILPIPIETFDISSNHFNASIDGLFLREALSLMRFNISNNSFTGGIPWSICKSSPLVQTLDFSMNRLTGSLPPALGECRNVLILRAGSNSLSGWLPNNLYDMNSLKELSLPNNQFSGPISNRIGMLSNLTILELHDNQLSGELPPHIGSLSNLEKLQLYANSLNGTLPSSLMECSHLRTLIIRNNSFGGEISNLNFSKLGQLEAVDLGNNSFVGSIPESLFASKSLLAVRLAYNKLVGELPPITASLRHLSLAQNNLSNIAGALKILSRCESLNVLFLWGGFHEDTKLQQINGLHPDGFRNLEYFTLGSCRLRGPIPFWISKLTKLRLLDISGNEVSGPIPSWLGTMPSLFSLNLTQNLLSGELPPALGRMPAMITEGNTSTDYLALPFVAHGLQYNRLLNMRRQLQLGDNSLSGSIPEEIGRLKLLQLLDLSCNNLNGRIPEQMHSMTNLEALNMSGNHLSGEIPASLTQLHFLSSFSVANNDLGGEIPRGGQFDTFAADSFAGNPKLCGRILGRGCRDATRVLDAPAPAEEELHWYHLPFGLGYLVGFGTVVVAFWLRIRVC